MNMHKTIVLSTFIFSCFQLSAKEYRLFSPDKNIQIIVSVTDKITWSVQYNTETVLQPGAIAMIFANGFSLSDLM